MKIFRILSRLVFSWAAWGGPLAGEEVPVYPDKKNLLVLRNSSGQEKVVQTPEEWSKRREHILANMEKVMGPLPRASKVALDLQVDQEEKFQDFVRRKISYQSSPGNRVTGYLFVPNKISGKAPAVVCLHPTSRDLGSGVPAGFGKKDDRHYAVHLVRQGYVTIAPDYVKSGSYTFDPYENGFHSATMLGIWNHMRAVDLLQTLPEVDGNRIGAIGHSLGGHNSMFLAVFDERIRCVVSNCGFCSFPTYMKGQLEGWSHAGYMPKIKSVYEAKPEKMPFDFPEIVAALAPRAFLASAPVRDHNFDAQGVKDCIQAARPVYALLGAREKLAEIYPDADHNFPTEVREVAYRWLDRWLKQP